MAKLLSKYDWNKHTYWNVDVNGTKYEIKDAKDEADAIALAESIDAMMREQPVKEQKAKIVEAVALLSSSDLKDVPKADRDVLSAKLSVTPAAKEGL